MTNLIFNLENMDPLDIVLVKGHGIIGKTIRTINGGNTSHVMLHKFNGVCIEAVRPNVMNYDLARSKCESSKNIKILRHQTLNKDSKINAAKEIDRLFGKEYSLLPHVIRRHDGIFCSMLVAYCYQNFKIKINDKNFNKVTPKDIEKDSNFIDITRTILTNAPSNDSPLGYDFIEKRELNPTERTIQKTCYNMAMSAIESDYSALCKSFTGKKHKETSIVSVISTLDVAIRNKTIHNSIHKKIRAIDAKVSNSFKKSQFLEEIDALSVNELFKLNAAASSMSSIEISNYINKSIEELKDLNSINNEWGVDLKLKSALILADFRKILINYHKERISILERVQVNA